MLDSSPERKTGIAPWLDDARFQVRGVHESCFGVSEPLKVTSLELSDLQQLVMA